MPWFGFCEILKFPDFRDFRDFSGFSENADFDSVYRISILGKVKEPWFGFCKILIFPDFQDFDNFMKFSKKNIDIKYTVYKKKFKSLGSVIIPDDLTNPCFFGFDYWGSHYIGLFHIHMQWQSGFDSIVHVHVDERMIFKVWSKCKYLIFTSQRCKCGRDIENRLKKHLFLSQYLQYF